MATGFIQSEPNEGQPATQRTEVRFLFDAEALYVGARMHDSLGAAGVRTRLGRRDQQVDSDWLTLVFDTFHDHLGRAAFEVNPSGVKLDALAMGDGGMDESWDPVWEVSTHIDSLGWMAELRIPFSQLRFSRETEQTWGVQIVRLTNRLNERAHFAFWTQQEVGGPSRYGHLEGLRITSRPQRAELLPYVVGRSSFIRPPRPDDPFNDGSLYDYRVGADLKYLLTSNLTLDATINPDFGQVEVDPAVVNLSAFETFFPEKRPFFIEGAGIFGFGRFSCFFCSNVSSLSLFYSRRVGRPPQGPLPARTEYSHVPEATTILGAAKITGRTAGGLSVGVLNAVTRRESASVIDTDGDRFDHPVEPLSNYFVGRVKRDYRGGGLVVGGIFTSVVRDLETDVLRRRLNRHAEAAGIDVVAAWNERRYSFTGQLATSLIAGDSAALLRAQTSSARYFQRPDRDVGSNGLFSSALDSGATTMKGYGGYARLAKEAGNFLWETSVNFRSPGFEVNDMAFLTSADYVWMNLNFFRQFTRPTRSYRRLFIIAGAQQQLNYDEDVTDRFVHGFLGGQARNYWDWNAFYIHRLQTLDDRATRGGPVVGRPATHTFFLNLSTDDRKPIVLRINPTYGWSAEGPRSYSASLDATIKPMSNVSISLGPAYSHSSSTQQYVATYDDSTAAEFYGRRYVFAHLVQRTLSMNTRVNVTFTPTLSFELFAQPFLASGDYFDFKEFSATRSLEKRRFGEAGSTIDTVRAADGHDGFYTVDADGASLRAPAHTFANPDFNLRSLRGNAVLRWEYRPGSTVFLVWTQRRADFAPLGDFDFARDRAALFRAHPDNVFLVKLNYWLGL